MASERDRLSIRRRRAGYCIENADIGEQLLARKSIGHAVFERIGPSLEIHTYSIRVLVVSRVPSAIRTAIDETRRNTLVYIAPFLGFDPTPVANQRKAAVERRCRHASDPSAGAVLEVDFGADEVL